MGIGHGAGPEDMAIGREAALAKDVTAAGDTENGTAAGDTT